MGDRRPETGDGGWGSAIRGWGSGKSRGAEGHRGMGNGETVNRGIGEPGSGGLKAGRGRRNHCGIQEILGTKRLGARWVGPESARRRPGLRAQ